MSETLNRSDLAVLHRELKKRDQSELLRLRGNRRAGRLATGEMKTCPLKEGEDPRRKGMRKS